MNTGFSDKNLLKSNHSIKWFKKSPNLALKDQKHKSFFFCLLSRYCLKSAQFPVIEIFIINSYSTKFLLPFLRTFVPCSSPPSKKYNRPQWFETCIRGSIAQNFLFISNSSNVDMLETCYKLWVLCNPFVISIERGKKKTADTYRTTDFRFYGI